MSQMGILYRNDSVWTTLATRGAELPTGGYADTVDLQLALTVLDRAGASCWKHVPSLPKSKK